MDGIFNGWHAKQNWIAFLSIHIFTELSDKSDKTNVEIESNAETEMWSEMY